MIRIAYTSRFVRQYKKLPAGLQREMNEKILLFAANPHHPSLRLHTLKGGLKGYFAFSVNYQYRVVCEKDAPDLYALLAVGDHDVYE